MNFEPNTLDRKLACLSEECAEVIQACQKAIRFGLFSTNPTLKPGDKHFGETNAEQIAREMEKTYVNDTKICLVGTEVRFYFAVGVIKDEA
jgi:hypothetical protein